MADETKNSQSALEQLKALQRNDSISSLDISEPALKGFDASSVFKIDNQSQETKHKIFGKRSARHATVTIQESVFDNDDVKVEDIFVADKFKPEAKEEAPAPKILSQEPIAIKEEPAQPEIIEETIEEVKEEPVEEVQEEQIEEIVEQTTQESESTSAPVFEGTSKEQEKAQPEEEIDGSDELG